MDDDILTGWIGGRWLRPGRVLVRENPGRTDEVAARWSPTAASHARAAVREAHEAFAGWSRRPVGERIAIVRTAMDDLRRHAEDLARTITRENGKTLREARAEVAAALADARFQLREAARAERPARPGAAVVRELRREPVGVFLLVTPWNFPFATVLRKLVPALAWGNTAVIKPAELTPGPAVVIGRALERAGLPAGAAGIVLGRGSEVGAAMVRHPLLRGVSFTGSTKNGLGIARSVAGRDVRLQLELGGKNALVVLADADLEAAVEAAVVGGLSCSGQWCTGTGRILVEEAVHDAFCARLIARVGALRPGPGDAEATDLGPLVSAERVRASARTVARARREGAVVHEGAPVDPRRGRFFPATVLTGVREDMEAFRKELFAPILPVVCARDFEDALRLANAGDAGLSASIFTRDRALAERFLREVEAGIAHVNLHTAFRTPDLPVAGWRESGRGVPECGRFTRDFFTRPRAVYLRS